MRSEQASGDEVAGAVDGLLAMSEQTVSRPAFTEASRRNVFRGNRMHGVRFAIHYMYTNASEVMDNISSGNHAAFVIMYSDGLKISGNISDGDRDQGLLLNFANGSVVEDNAVRGATKCVFIYNANKNRLRGNWFEGCKIGVHFTAGSERNEITANAFLNNETQVVYVGTRSLDWSDRRPRELLERQPGFRPQRRWHCRRGLPPEQHHGPGGLAVSGCEALAE